MPEVNNRIILDTKTGKVYVPSDEKYYNIKDFAKY